MRPMIAVALGALLAGCATAAQQQVQLTSRTIQQAQADDLACNRAVYDKPEFASVRPYVPDLQTGQLSITALTAEFLPTPDQATVLRDTYDALMSCGYKWVSAIETVRPDEAAIEMDEIPAIVQVRVLLIERKITWAEAARQDQKIEAQFRPQLAAADRQWAAGMNRANAAELAQRQAAFNAAMQFSIEEQAISAAQRPVVTTCPPGGAVCVSY